MVACRPFTHTMAGMKIKVEEAKNGQLFANIVADNGEIVAHSNRLYPTSIDAVIRIVAYQKAAALSTDVVAAGDDEWRWVLLADGESVFYSENLVNKTHAEDMARRVKGCFSDLVIELPAPWDAP